MTSVVFSVFLLLQTASPAAGVRVVTGHLSVEGGAPAPSSFTLPLMAGGGVPTPALPAAGRSLTIRPQIDGAFRVQLPVGEYRVGAPGRLPPGCAAGDRGKRENGRPTPIKQDSSDAAITKRSKGTGRPKKRRRARLLDQANIS